MEVKIQRMEQKRVCQSAVGRREEGVTQIRGEEGGREWEAEE